MIAVKSIRIPVLWVAVGLGVFTHTAYFLVDHDHYGTDTPSYLIPAENMLHGYGFVNALHQPEIRRTPGYPLLLWGFLAVHIPLGCVVLVQHLFCVLLVLFLTLLTSRLAGSDLAGLAAAIALSFDFATIRIANLLLTEIAATVLIAILTWILYCATEGDPTPLLIAGTGVLGGCATLLRPVTLLYWIPLLLYLLLVSRRHAFRSMIILLISFLILPVLWTVRNYHRVHYFGLTTISAEDVLFYRATGALAIQMPGHYPDNILQVRAILVAHTCPDLEIIFRRPCDQVSEAQKSSYFVHKGIDIISAHPASYLYSAMVGLLYTVFGGGAEAVSKLIHVGSRSAQAIVLLFTIPEACLTIAGCRFWYRRNRHLAFLLVLTVCYFLLVSAGAEAYSRFKVPVMTMYAMLVGGGAMEARQALRRFRAQSKSSGQSGRSPVAALPFSERLG